MQISTCYNLYVQCIFSSLWLESCLLYCPYLNKHIHSPDSPSEPEPILPPALIVSPLVWNIDKDIQAATLTEPALLGGPEGKTYVPTSQRQPLLGSVHNVPGSGHPGSQRTLSFLQARYWWLSMSRDVIRYIRGCLVCAMSKSPHHLPVGKLVPLPIPQRPWSHLGFTL